MAEQPDLPARLRCRNCGHKISIDDAPPPGSPEAGRCPNCGERSLILTAERPEKKIKLS